MSERNIRFTGRSWKVEIWRRPRVHRWLCGTLAEAIKIRSAFEAANPKGRPGAKPTGLPWKDTEGERIKAGLCKTCGEPKTCRQQNCEDCRRVVAIKRKARAC